MPWGERDKVIFRVLTVMGNRDHYAHFMLDFMIPLWGWLYQNSLLHREDLTVYYWDNAIERYLPILNAFFNCKLEHVSALVNPLGIERVMVMGMESHNRKLMNIELEHYIGSPKKFINDLRDYAIKKFDITASEHADKVLYIRREKTGEDRGADRRSTSNEPELSDALRHLAEEKGLEFEEVYLEGMRFSLQVELFANAKAVVAQHGASLVNLFWMRSGSVLFEYHWNDSEAYRKRQFCNFFGQPLHFHLAGLRPESSIVEAPIQGIVDVLGLRL